MSRIALLPETVACQVAAGEVVERPASVVKELVENSLDAEATRIEVLIRKGGNSSIRIVDNGIGMDRDDALLCLERHATSKIRTGDDLMAIHTLGFRGEALPSIASVSRFRLATRERGALAGTEVIVNGGKLDSVRDCGEPEGTQIEVRSLFYNLPARRKFLRTENTEASHVEHVLHLQAAGHPHVGFTFLNDERLVYQLPPGQSLRERIRDLYGPALAAELLEVPDEETGGLRVRGFLGKAGVSRSTRQQQIVFLNGRPVENPALNYALREGYHTALMKGQHPVTFLFVDLDPAAVDVNVHPSKREVRFRDPSLVREILVEVVRRTLETDRAAWTRTFAAPAPPVSSVPSAETPPLIPVAEQTALRRDWAELPRQSHRSGPTPAIFPSNPPAAAPQNRGAAVESTELPTSTPEIHRPDVSQQFPGQFTQPAKEAGTLPGRAPDKGQLAPAERNNQQFRILGILGKLYILMENAAGLVLVDQHAAHERILYEEMKRRMESQSVPSQRLLLPITLQVPPRDADWILQHLDLFARAGIGLEPFGAATFKIDGLPQFLRADDPPQLLRDIIDELRESSSQGAKLRLGEDMIAKTVCRHAVKANDVLREPECVRLIQDLLACELPYCCPHGRPTMIQLSYGELEKKFGRKV
jgi:DNA mismatch repair protein MutL